MDELFNQESTHIKIYLALEVEADPLEKNVTLTYLQPVPIKAIVTDLTATQIRWKSYGAISEDGKEILCKKKYRTLLENSQKIIVQGETNEYEGYRVNGKMSIREEGNYIRCIIYRKNV